MYTKHSNIELKRAGQLQQTDKNIAISVDPGLPDRLSTVQLRIFHFQFYSLC